MRTVNHVTREFHRRIRDADTVLQAFQNTVNGFNGGNLPTQIRFTLDRRAILTEVRQLLNTINNGNYMLRFRISESTLRTSIDNWINGLGNGTKLTHLPLILKWATLRDSINDFLTAANQGKHGISTLRLRIDRKSFIDDINLVLANDKNFNKIKLDIDPVNLQKYQFDINARVDRQALIDDINLILRNENNFDPMKVKIDQSAIQKSFDVDLRINTSTLKTSVENWIDTLGGGHFIKHLPLKVLPSSIKSSVEDIIDEISKSRKNSFKIPFKMKRDASDDVSAVASQKSGDTDKILNQINGNLIGIKTVVSHEMLRTLLAIKDNTRPVLSQILSLF